MTSHPVLSAGRRILGRTTRTAPPRGLAAAVLDELLGSRPRGWAVVVCTTTSFALAEDLADAHPALRVLAFVLDDPTRCRASRRLQVHPEPLTSSDQLDRGVTDRSPIRLVVDAGDGLASQRRLLFDRLFGCLDVDGWYAVTDARAGTDMALRDRPGPPLGPWLCALAPRIGDSDADAAPAGDDVLADLAEVRAIGDVVAARRRTPRRPPPPGADPVRRVKRREVVACRADGLGERLNAIVTGLKLAELLDLPFSFTWGTELLGAENHAITGVADFFAPEFIARHHRDHADLSRLLELTAPRRSPAALDEALVGYDGLRGTRLGLDEVLDARAWGPQALDLSGIFERIGFSPAIREAVEHARNAPLPAVTAGLHLRSGDVFYGPYRKWVHYSYKGLTLPIAKAMISKAQERGESVLVMGQDLDVIDYLRAELGVITVEDLPGREWSPAQQAMYDLVLLSRCRPIMSGSSGFARQASWLSGQPVTMPGDLFSWHEQTAIALHDLEQHAETYHPLQSAFGYWYAYYYGRQFRPSEDNLRLLERAAVFDPDNELYPLVGAALLYKLERDDEADDRVAELITRRGVEETGATLVATTLRAFNLAEYFPYLEGAANRRRRWAQLLLARIRIAQGRSGDARKLLPGPRAELPADVVAHVAELAR